MQIRQYLPAVMDLSVQPDHADLEACGPKYKKSA